MDKYLPGPYYDLATKIKGDGSVEDQVLFRKILGDIEEYDEEEGDSMRSLAIGILTSILARGLVAGLIAAVVSEIIDGVFDQELEYNMGYEEYVKGELFDFWRDIYQLAYYECLYEAAQIYLGANHLTHFPCEYDQQQYDSLLAGIEARKKRFRDKYKEGTGNIH